MLLKEKVAIVTGGSSGIGASIAEEMAREGAKVVISDIQDEAGEKLAKDLSAKFNTDVIYKHADVSSFEDCQKLTETAVNEFGGLDIAVNNAGISGEQVPLVDCSLDNWNKVMDVNLNSVFYCMKTQIPEMIKRGGGSIINMSSILGVVGFPSGGPYTATKHALLGLTKTAAWEYGANNVRVNAIGPAFIKTPILEVLDKETLDFMATKHAFGRLGKPEEIAHLTVFLASDKASFLTGSYYPADAGFLAL